MRTTFILVLLFITSHSLFGQYSTNQWTHFLRNPIVSSVVETTNSIWIIVNGELIKLDPQTKERQPLDIPYGYFFSKILKKDSGNLLLLDHQSDQVYEYNPQNNEFTVFPIHSGYTAIYQKKDSKAILDPTGNIWLAGRQNLARYDITTNTWTIVNDNTVPYTFYNIDDIAIDPTNNILYVAHGRLASFDLNTDTWLEYEHDSLSYLADNIPYPDNYNYFSKDRLQIHDGKIWHFTSQYGIWFMNLGDTELDYSPSPFSYLNDDDLDHSTLVINNQLTYINHHEGLIATYDNGQWMVDSALLNNNLASSTYSWQDASGESWIFHGNQIIQLNDLQQKHSFCNVWAETISQDTNLDFSTLHKPRYLMTWDDRLFTISADKLYKNVGNDWVATSPSLINYQTNGNLIFPNNSSTYGKRSNFAVDAADQLWFMLYDSLGSFKIVEQQANNWIEHIPSPNWDSMAAPTEILINKQGTVWVILTDGTIWEYINNSWSISTVSFPIFNNNSTSYYAQVARDGNFWWFDGSLHMNNGNQIIDYPDFDYPSGTSMGEYSIAIDPQHFRVKSTAYAFSLGDGGGTGSPTYFQAQTFDLVIESVTRQEAYQDLTLNDYPVFFDSYGELNLAVPHSSGLFYVYDGQNLSFITRPMLSPLITFNQTNDAENTFFDRQGNIWIVTPYAVSKFTPPSSITSVNNIENAPSSSIKLYPNPTEDILNIETEQIINQVLLYNLQGQEIPISWNNNPTLSTGHLPQGAYILQVILENGKKNSQVFIKK
ncbi:MAG: T9SS type A sorting domain-containing protein [Saprospiraceae bacterium]|nr:T9SS type A sorting domain-containing protein [Saprospiraceae bacterium]